MPVETGRRAGVHQVPVSTLPAVTGTAEFRVALDYVARTAGRLPEPWVDRPGVYQFRVASSILPAIQDDVIAAGFLLVGGAIADEVRVPAFLFPTNDPYEALRALGASAEMISWFHRVDKEHSVQLRAAGPNFCLASGALSNRFRFP